MTKNIGRADKIVRIIAGITALALGIYLKSWWGVIGIIPLLTAFISWCPAYSVFGVSTCGTSCGCGSSTCETTK
ncbi:MAG: DUF2892 domain-containing protein [Nitrospiraceae bacterium]|nr:MAG: DUF2892 domain-containing protein [Nitrospiraceae bacterium]